MGWEYGAGDGVGEGGTVRRGALWDGSVGLAMGGVGGMGL